MFNSLQISNQTLSIIPIKNSSYFQRTDTASIYKENEKEKEDNSKLYPIIESTDDSLLKGYKEINEKSNFTFSSNKKRINKSLYGKYKNMSVDFEDDQKNEININLSNQLNVVIKVKNIVNKGRKGIEIEIQSKLSNNLNVKNYRSFFSEMSLNKKQYWMNMSLDEKKQFLDEETKEGRYKLERNPKRSEYIRIKYEFKYGNTTKYIAFEVKKINNIEQSSFSIISSKSEESSLIMNKNEKEIENYILKAIIKLLTKVIK